MDYSQRLDAVAQQPDWSKVRAQGDVYCSVRRFFARVIDQTLITAGLLAAVWKLDWIHTSTAYIVTAEGTRVPVTHFGLTNQLGASLLGVAIAMGYYTLLEWAAGWTIGKLVLGIKVVSLSGEQISVMQAVVRNVLLVADCIFGCLPAFISMMSSDCRQRIGDRVAGTMVIRW